MEVCESERRQTLEAKPRPPLVPAEKLNNAIATRRPRIREVSSRYKSPTPSRPSPPSAAAAAVVRASSPTAARTVRSSAAPKRSVSADRKRPSTPPSPSSTLVKDSATARRTGGRRVAGEAAAVEGLWPSTMRSLSVSFQSDSISIPVSVSKKEKTVSSNALSDRTLRTSSSNVAHRQAESTAGSPRKRSPLRAKITGGSDQSENSKPVDGLHSRLIDQHRWPSRVGGKISSVGITNSNSASLHKSMDLGPRIVRLTATPAHHHQTSSRAGMERANSVDDSSLHKLVSTSLSERLSLAVPKVRSLSRPSSPSKVFSSSVPRGVISPAGSRPSTPPSRGVSPSRTRASGTTSCHSSSSNATSVLSFIADFKGKKSTGYIEDAHQLRLLHNRFLQWRFANARAEAVLYAQKVTAERTLLNVWNTTLSLWDSVIRKRVKLQQLNLELKLNSVLNDQMGCLEDWALLERDHIAAFSGAMEDLEASTLRLPVTGGARTDIESLKIAICSAVDVMQAMGSSICSLLSRVEGVNGLVSELAVVAAQEKAMLDECEALLASAAVMQVEEYSLRTQLVQMKQDFGIVSGQFWQPRHQLLDPD